MRLLCTKDGIVDKTLTPIEDGEPMQCPICLDFTVEVVEDEPEVKTKVKIFNDKKSTSLKDYLGE